jgi:hypothetical protein
MKLKKAKMKEIPILFSASMVQAILEGRKTMTRRIIEVPDLITAPDRFRHIGDHSGRDFPRPAIKYDDRIWHEWQLTNSNEASWVERCRWKKGDLLWVRENFRVNSWVPDDGELTFRYEADGTISPYIGFDDDKIFNRYWEQSCSDLADAGNVISEDERYQDYEYQHLRLRPNIFLPKNAARIWLQVTGVRVERLQDISLADAKAEGVEMITGGAFPYKHYGNDSASCANAIASFESLWREINGDEAWDANPWVWAITFKTLSTTGKP